MNQVAKADCAKFSHQRDRYSAACVRAWLHEAKEISVLLETGRVHEAHMAFRQWSGQLENLCVWVEAGAPWLWPK